MYLYRRIRLVNVSGWSPAKYAFSQRRIQNPLKHLRWNFCKNREPLWVVIYFGKKIHLRCLAGFNTGPATTRGQGGNSPPLPHFFFRSKKKIGGKRKKRKSFKAKTIKRLSPRSRCYYFSHSRASRIEKFFLSANHGGRHSSSVFHGPSTLKSISPLRPV